MYKKKYPDIFGNVKNEGGERQNLFMICYDRNIIA